MVGSSQYQPNLITSLRFRSACVPAALSGRSTPAQKSPMNLPHSRNSTR